MKYRKLRIAWSVAWGILCLSLIALWVRSYWMLDEIDAVLPGTTILQVSSVPGNVGLALIEDTSHQIRRAPRNLHISVDSFLATRNSGSSHFTKFRSGFSLRPTSTYMPYWAPVALTTAIATLSWLPMRLSLRTLLIAMTVAAIGLGWIVYATRN